MRTARQIERLLLLIVGVFLLLDIVAVAVLLTPSGRANIAREAEFNNLRSVLARKKAEALPSNEVGTKLITANQQIHDFYRDRLPASYADISNTLGKLASEHHVQLVTVKYDSKPVSENLTRVNLEVGVLGNYTDVVKYVNSLEREKTLVLLQEVNFAGRSERSEGLQVSMRLETYLAGIAAPAQASAPATLKTEAAGL